MIKKDIINRWFSEECSSDTKEDKIEGTEWVLIGEFASIPITIVHQTDSDFIQIQRALKVSEEHKRAINGRTKLDKEHFLYSLKRGLIFVGARWMLDFSDSLETDLNGIRIFEKIYSDGLTRNEFVKQINNVHDASVLFFIELGKLLQA